MSHIAQIVFGCLVLLVRGALADVTEISTCPYTILQPGQYHIANNLTCRKSGIDVVASNVQLHFDGHTLNGMGAGQIGVLVTGSNDRIFGSGTVTNFQFGIVVESVDENVPTSGNQIVNITVTNSLSQGIVLINSVQNNIISCTANKNRTDGIFLGSSSNRNTLISNTASGNGSSGIHLFDDNNNILIANEADGNGFDGIFVDFGLSGNLILANKAVNNSSFDLADSNSNCDSNTWKSNQFRTANQPCIH